MFDNGPNYDYHSIIRKRDEEFSSQFDGLGEKTEKYTPFTIPIRKQNENGKTLTCKIKLIDVSVWLTIKSLLKDSTKTNAKIACLILKT